MPSKKVKKIESAEAEVLAAPPVKAMATVTAIAPPQKLKPRAKKKAVALESANGLAQLAEAVAPEPTSEGDTVAMRAYFRWQERGCPAGSAEEDWLEAERELQHA